MSVILGAMVDAPARRAACPAIHGRHDARAARLPRMRRIAVARIEHRKPRQRILPAIAIYQQLALLHRTAAAAHPRVHGLACESVDQAYQVFARRNRRQVRDGRVLERHAIVVAA